MEQTAHEDKINESTGPEANREVRDMIRFKLN